MLQIAALLLVLGTPVLAGCATNLGTGSHVIASLEATYPITVGRLVAAQLDTSHRLRVYLQICEDADAQGPVCSEESLRVLAMVEADKKSLLQRIASRYLEEGRDHPVYVYGPLCEGLQEMILVPRCQLAVALSIWDPHLEDYVVYSTTHGSGSFIESEGFNTFLEVTGRAAGIVKKAAK
jgi:hypothetical protein